MRQKDLKQLSDKELSLVYDEHVLKYKNAPTDDSEESRELERNLLIDGGVIQREIASRQCEPRVITTFIDWIKSGEIKPTKELQEETDTWLNFSGVNDGDNQEQVIANRRKALGDLLVKWQSQFKQQVLHNVDSVIQGLAGTLPNYLKEKFN